MKKAGDELIWVSVVDDNVEGCHNIKTSSSGILLPEHVNDTQIIR